MSKDIRFFELNNGAKIPSVGLGTWQSSSGLVGQAVAAAIKVGYRHIDCAQIYGNEEEIGSVLKKLFEEGVVKREDLWITSKLWNTDHAPEDVPLALDRTLKDLQLDYVDLYLIHWPAPMKKGSAGFKPENLVPPNIPDTWRAMEALYDSGKARAIGVSNFSSKKLGDLLEISRIPPAVNQVECHPSWQQEKLRAFCKSKGVHLSGYSPLGSPGTTWLKSDVLKHPVLNMIAEKLGKTHAQVALRWGLQMGHTVLPKSTNEARIKENFDVFDWSIPEDLFAKFSEIQQHVPLPPPSAQAPPTPKSGMELRIPHAIYHLNLQIEHILTQQSANYRAMMHLHHGLYHSIPMGQFNPWMDPAQFAAYVAWPGDRPILPGRGETSQTRPGSLSQPPPAREHAPEPEQDADTEDDAQDDE